MWHTASSRQLPSVLIYTPLFLPLSIVTYLVRSSTSLIEALPLTRPPSSLTPSPCDLCSTMPGQLLYWDSQDRSKTPPSVPQLDALIVGAGWAGLWTLHSLRKKGLKVLLTESNADVGTSARLVDRALTGGNPHIG